MKKELFSNGSFIIGCNYWASHAGTNMWHDWDVASIERDFALLKRHKIQYLRVFPLWPDFQPLTMHYMVMGDEKELRMGEEPLPHTEAGQAGVDEIMVERFRTFCDLATKHGLHLIVGLITGWMSGRLYAPEAFRTVNLLTDARAIKWQIKFVKYMVRTFRYHKAIAAWDLGNECNCLGHCPSQDAAYLWASSITMAIKTEDTSRPVISGMHSTFPEAEFRPKDLGEILDVLCTHPYPLFTPHCMTDPIIENKSVLHATAETVLYRGLSGKVAFTEEIGTLGPMIASEENAAAYINTVLHLLWAHDCLGLLWWCGFEQSHLTHTPYDWNAVERELGLFRADYTPKPVLLAMSQFASMLEAEEFRPLPPRMVDAVCVLTAEQDSWRAAYGSFLLAKEAGLDIEFCHIDDKLPQAHAYLLPSVSHDHVAAHTLRPILERVKEGAVLYVSVGEALLSPFKEIFGLVPQYRYIPKHPDRVALAGYTFEITPSFKTPYADGTARVLARDENGTAVMAESSYGKGTVYFLAYPIEDMAAGAPGVISGEEEIPYHLFYRAMPKLRHPDRRTFCDNAHVAITEHTEKDGSHTVVAVNCTPREQTAHVSATDGYTLRSVRYSQGATAKKEATCVTVNIPANSAIVLEFDK